MSDEVGRSAEEKAERLRRLSLLELVERRLAERCADQVVDALLNGQSVREPFHRHGLALRVLTSLRARAIASLDPGIEVHW